MTKKSFLREEAESGIWSRLVGSIFEMKGLGALRLVRLQPPAKEREAQPGSGWEGLVLDGWL